VKELRSRLGALRNWNLNYPQLGYVRIMARAASPKLGNLSHGQAPAIPSASDSQRSTAELCEASDGKSWRTG
jgi:hypothetical protein